MLPPGPPLPAAVQTLLVWRWWDRYVKACARRYGDVFTIRAFPFDALVYLADPEHVREVFTGRPSLFHAGEANSFMVPILGPHSVLTSDEDDHLRRRKLTSPMFHGEAVRNYADVVAAVTDAEVDRWRAGETLALHPRMRELTFEVILRAVFGVTEPARLARLREVLPPVTEVAGVTMLLFVWPQLEKAWPWTRWVRARARADAVLHEEIALRRADPALAERRDVLSLLLQAGEMDDAEVRDHLMTLLLAGHETTATALGSRGPLAWRATTSRRGPRWRPRSGSCSAIRAATTRPTSCGPSASSPTARPSRTRGSRSAAACGAASGPPSRRWRCASCSPPCCGAPSCAPPSPRPSARSCAT